MHYSTKFILSSADCAHLMTDDRANRVVSRLLSGSKSDVACELDLVSWIESSLHRNTSSNVGPDTVPWSSALQLSRAIASTPRVVVTLPYELSIIGVSSLYSTVTQYFSGESFLLALRVQMGATGVYIDGFGKKVLLGFWKIDISQVEEIVNVLQ